MILIFHQITYTSRHSDNRLFQTHTHTHIQSEIFVILPNTRISKKNYWSINTYKENRLVKVHSFAIETCERKKIQFSILLHILFFVCLFFQLVTIITSFCLLRFLSFFFSEFFFYIHSEKYLASIKQTAAASHWIYNKAKEIQTQSVMQNKYQTLTTTTTTKSIAFGWP